MTHFDRSLLPLPSDFYRKEIGPLTRPNRKSWALGNCPFHRSKSKKSFSVHLSDGGWFCLGCGERGGDVISFMQKRYRLTFRQACEELGAWRDLSRADQSRIAEQQRKRQEAKERDEATALEQKRRRLEARDWLHALESLQKEVSAEVAELERAHPGVESHEKDMAFANLCLLVDLIRKAEAEYFELSGLAEKATQ